MRINFRTLRRADFSQPTLRVVQRAKSTSDPFRGKHPLAATGSWTVSWLFPSRVARNRICGYNPAPELPLSRSRMTPMSMDAAPASGPLSPFEQLRYARQIIQMEAQALDGLATRLDTEFCRAVEELYHCPGSVIVTGIGKAGLIGQKMAATLSSTGTRSHFLHAGEAVHGDLGRIHRSDTARRPLAKRRNAGSDPPAAVARITRHRDHRDHRQPPSTLGRAAHVTLALGPLKEACALGLAPSTSTTAMLAMGDALALVTSRMRVVWPRRFCPLSSRRQLGAAIGEGRGLHAAAGGLPRSRLQPERAASVHRAAFARAGVPERSWSSIRTEILRGIFTDSDLARLFESRRDGALDGPIRDVMTKSPTAVPQRIDARRRGRDHGRAENQRIAGGRCGGHIRWADRHDRRGGVVSGGESGVTGRAAGKVGGGAGAQEPRVCQTFAVPSTIGAAACATIPDDGADGGDSIQRVAVHELSTERAEPIELILSDVDGVLTDGGVVFDNQGIETKRFHIRDGLGIKLWRRAGYRFGLVTGRSSHIVRIGAAELGIEIVRQGIEDKLAVTEQIVAALRPAAATGLLHRRRSARPAGDALRPAWPWPWPTAATTCARRPTM